MLSPRLATAKLLKCAQSGVRTSTLRLLTHSSGSFRRSGRVAADFCVLFVTRAWFTVLITSHPFQFIVCSALSSIHTLSYLSFFLYSLLSCFIFSPRIGAKRNPYRDLVGKSERKKERQKESYVRFRRRYEGSI